MKKEIIEILQKRKKLSINDLKKFYTKKINDDFLDTIDQLVAEGVLCYDENSMFYSLTAANFFIGEIMETKKGYPYIIFADEKISLKFENLKSALPGDLVKLKKVNNTYVLEEIINRNHSKFIVEVYIENGKKKLKAVNYPCFYTIKIEKKYLRRLVEGDRLVMHPDLNLQDKCITGSLADFICNKKDPNADAITLCFEQGFRCEFSKATYLELKKIKTSVTESDFERRIDLTNDEVITIDPNDAQDLDDAYSLEKTEYGYLLKTHTADVAAYVKFGSAIFNDALLNTTSVYLDGFVLAMFPHLLSSGICSLHQNVNRLVRTVEIKLDESGNVLDYRKYKSVIRSRKQMNYDDVEKVFKKENVEGYEPFIDLLTLTKELGIKLNKIKNSRGYLNFESNEINFVKGVDDTILSATRESGGLSHEFIENIMVLTNSLKIESFGTLPIIYRNHPLPDKKKIEDALKKLKELDIHLPESNNKDTKFYLQKVLQTLSKEDGFLVLTKVILTSFERAYYDIENSHHFGLGLDTYSHTTSPIRRIVDYMVQYCEDFYEQENITDNDIENLSEVLLNIAKIASERERAADKVEYKSTQIQMAKFMENKVGETFEMLISDISPTSISVVARGMTEGKIMLSNPEQIRLSYNPTTNSVKDENSNQYKISHTLLVRLTSVNVYNGLMEYTLIDNLTIKSKKKPVTRERKIKVSNF